ncbi:hypothetical protein SAMN02744778_00872 [Pantoea sp. GL120224-02]|nr:hypothetical protein SAMN02744778_00872 [Pantoea sp. GL120224-02]
MDRQSVYWWKLHNLSNMQPSKHTEALAKLKEVLLITT